MTTEVRPHRKTLVGWVVSDKMDKTRVIEVRWSKPDYSYGKVRNHATRLYAHDEKNESKLGDHVKVMSTRPLSRMKRWLVTGILKKA